jgi:hypothetical protein
MDYSTNMNKTNNHLSPQTIQHKKIDNDVENTAQCLG